MTKDAIYAGGQGLPIGLDTRVNLTGATRAVLEVKRPDGSIVFWPAEIVERGGVMGGLLYHAKAGDLAEDGVYSIHPVVDLGTLKNQPGREVRLLVKKRHGGQ